MTHAEIYTCDGCRGEIESKEVLHYNQPREGVVYVREMLTVKRQFIAAVAVHERTRYEWHFCSWECLASFSTSAAKSHLDQEKIF